MDIRQIRVEDSVGQALAHDMTKIIPGKFKGVGFKRNHRVRAEDIPELLKIGKKHIYEPIAKLLLPVIPAKAGIQKLLFLVETGFPDQVGE